MNKLWMVLMLLFSAGSYAAEKADFKLKWQEEPKKEILQKRNDDLRGYINDRNKTPPNMFGHVDKANRLRYSDPQFSAYNSDGGSRVYIRR